MDLLFATVLSCDGNGCYVSYMDGPEAVVWAPYSAEVQDRMRIRRQQLVAVERATQPPQIVWRWICGEALELQSGSALVGAYGICVELPLRDPSLRLHKGDEVWIGGGGGEKAIRDLVRGDYPANSGALAAQAFPQIEAWYTKTKGR